MPHPKHGYKEGEIFTDQKGNLREVVAVIGNFGPKPTIVVTDVKGREHYLSPSISLEKFSVISSILPELDGQQGDDAIPILINMLSEICIKDAPYFAPEYIEQNFNISTTIKLIESVVNLAAELVNANIKQYNGDESVKNGQSGTNRSGKGGYRNQKRRNNVETGQE